MSTTEAEPTAVTWSDPLRRAAFERWLAAVAPRHGLDAARVEPASADASFRRYLRVAAGDTASGRRSLVVMDAPPPLEDVRPFVKVAGLIERAGLNAPRVLEADVEHGFLLLTDLGRRSYLDALREGSPAEIDRLMREALATLVRFQQHVPADALPPFDAKLLQWELDLFADWCVPREFGITWNDKQRATWQRLCALLVSSALAQPQVAVHADWMPRNLMLPAGEAAANGPSGPGILDFQDAVRGPITYDIVCQLRDAFVSWDEEREIDWAVRWWQLAKKAGLPVHEDFGECWRALEWMGLQRHLKVMGIFCRLKHRDGKPRYAEDLPRFFAYANKVAMRYRPLEPLVELLEPMSGVRAEVGFTF